VPIEYNLVLVFLSVLIAMQGGYVSLTLANWLGQASGIRRKSLLAASALSLGIGIWAMHFIGMLAVNLPVVVTYDVLTTLLSALVCVLLVGLGVFVASFGLLTPLRLAQGSVLMGGGIATMHYIGMSALRANCVVDYAPDLVAASVAVAIAASALALWLAFSPSGKHHVMAGAVVMGLAVSGMHYTAMAAARFLPDTLTFEITAPTLTVDLLAIVVAVTAFLISGFFLLVLLPERLGAWDGQAAGAAPAVVTDEAATAGGGADIAASPAASDPVGHISASRNGVTLFLPFERVYAIHADAHYTRVFDGRDTYFCAVSISDLEARLDPACFVRVHRSHIINIRHAAALRRIREQGVIELDGLVKRRVPVSRNRLPKLKAALGL
jgi:NO-binding membrane sensor protein with MHYT domain